MKIPRSFVCHVLSLVIAGFGILSIASPGTFIELLRHSQSPGVMYVGAGFRLIFGVSLLMSAAKSRTPDVLRVLGWFFIVAGLLIPIFGFEFFRSVVDSFLSLGLWAARVWGVVALAFGLAIAHSVAPRSRTS